jgi:hypothetical protein
MDKREFLMITETDIGYNLQALIVIHCMSIV